MTQQEVLQVLVPLAMLCMAGLYFATRRWEYVAARELVTAWAARGGLVVTQFGGGSFKRCPFNCGGKNDHRRVYYVVGRLSDGTAVRGLVMCTGTEIHDSALTPDTSGASAAVALHARLHEPPQVGRPWKE